MKKSLYDLLGVSKKADAAEIKRAYRKKAQKAHPDKGGSHEEISALNEAWRVLGDESSRHRYDESGSTEIPKDPRRVAEQGVVVLLMSMLSSEDEFEGNIINFLKDRVKANSANIRQGIGKQEQKIRKLEKMLKRLKGPMVKELIDAQLDACRSTIKRGEEQLETDKLVQELLQEYSDDWKPGGDRGSQGDRPALPDGLMDAMTAAMQQKAQGRRSWFY